MEPAAGLSIDEFIQSIRLSSARSSHSPYGPFTTMLSDFDRFLKISARGYSIGENKKEKPQEAQKAGRGE